MVAVSSGLVVAVEGDGSILRMWYENVEGEGRNTGGLIGVAVVVVVGVGKLFVEGEVIVEHEPLGCMRMVLVGLRVVVRRPNRFRFAAAGSSWEWMRTLMAHQTG